MRIRAQAPLLWRSPGQCQIGVDPRDAVIIEGLSPQEQDLLAGLSWQVTRAELYRRARASQIPLEQAHQVLRRLREAGVLIKDDGDVHDRDECYWEQFTQTPSARTRALRHSCVALLGCGELLIKTGLLLAQAGVGTILTEEPQLRSLLMTHFPLVARRVIPPARADLAIMIDPYVSDPVRERALSQDAITHLPVTVTQARISIGPLLSQASPLCRSCLELWTLDKDPCWSTIATQARLLPPPPLERLLTHQASAMIARASLDALSDAPAWWLTHSYEMSALPSGCGARSWQPHPRCPCHLHSDDAATPADQAVAPPIPA